MTDGESIGEVGGETGPTARNRPVSESGSGGSPPGEPGDPILASGKPAGPPPLPVTETEEAATATGAKRDTGTEGGSRRGNLRSIWREWVWPFIVVLLVVSTFRSAVADWNDVPTGSMKPTILPGERIFVNKVAYDLKIPFTRFRIAQWEDPQRGDVVVLFSPADGKRLVKRVVGVPGDIIEMRRNRLLVNGEPAEYQPYTPEDLDELGFHPPPRATVLSETVESEHHPVLWISYAHTGSSFPAFEVPEDHYYVMGDNRNESRDSRWFGPVERGAIVGRATAVVISFDRNKSFSPRWDRFFLSLP